MTKAQYYLGSTNPYLNSCRNTTENRNHNQNQERSSFIFHNYLLF